jgi:hypothetical protein
MTVTVTMGMTIAVVLCLALTVIMLNLLIIVSMHSTILVPLASVLLAALTLLGQRHTPNGIALGLGHLTLSWLSCLIVLTDLRLKTVRL